MPPSNQGRSLSQSSPTAPPSTALSSLRATPCGAAPPEDDSNELIPDPKTLKFPPRPKSVYELPAPLDFLTPSKFHGDFPRNAKANRIKNFPPEQIEKDTLSTRVILHPRMPLLLGTFLEHKRAHGSQYEKRLYQNMNWHQLATRMISKRPLCFLQSCDFTRLRDNRLIGAAYEEWDRVGTPAQHLNTHLFLDDYLSYEEIMLSSLLGASAPTYFINSDNRFNAAQSAHGGVAHEPRGVVVGLVGPRFDRDGQHDTPLIFKPLPPGEVLGGSMDPSVCRIVQQWLLPGVDPDARPPAARYLAGGIDPLMYKARLRVSFELLLLEAEARAKAVGRDAVVHVVGLGLGVWRKLDVQTELYIEAFAECLRETDLGNVAAVEFGWIENVSEGAKRRVREAGAVKKIDVRFTKKDPCRKLTGDDEGRLLVVSWAWDGNSHVGNEYWNGHLSSSSDPAAVCFSTIGEIMNPDINPFADRVIVLGVGNGEESQALGGKDIS